MARIVNCFINALNDNMKLPRLVVIIPDHDILNYIYHYTSGISLICGSAIDWITSQVDRAVEIRKDYLRVRSIGAVSANEPKFLWIRALG